MNKSIFTKFTPHIIAVLIFTVISFIYFKPILAGKQMIGHDTNSWMCMAKKTLDYNATHHDAALWTDAMFGGMPTYQISMKQPYNLIKYVEDIFHIYPNTIYFLMLYFIGFYIMLLTFRVDPWLSIAGSIAFAFASFNFIILSVGHNSQAITIAYMAPLIGAVFMAYRRNLWTGGILTAFFLSLAIRANHVQILYYTLLILIILGIVELVFSIKNKEIKKFLKTTGVIFAAAVVAVGMNATTLLTTSEYTQYTMRGKSNGLSSDSQSSQHGLSKQYITSWSYGVGETMTLLIPDFKGGASAGTLSADSETASKLKSLGVPNVDQTMKKMQLPLYWGDQPYTAGPVYLGAIVIFLFVLGFFVVDKRTLWWLVPMIVLTLMLSWGRHFMWLTNIFIDHVPLYNKFRTVSMMLVATGFGITLMAMLALKEVLNPKADKQKFVKPMLISAAIVGGISLIFALIPSLAGSFVSPADAQFKGSYAFLKETLPMDREALLRGDAFRSLLFVLLSTAVLWFYLKDKMKLNLAVGLFAVLFLADLVPIAKRYLNDDNFTYKKRLSTLVQPTKADQMIMQDKSNYRVLDGTVNIFNDATPSYFFDNIGGYHAAKMRRYQELIDMQIQGEIGKLFGAFSHAKSFNDIQPTLDSLGVLNMLNMKYVIYNKDAAPLVNPYANGSVWLVDKVIIANDANQEMAMLGKIDTKHEAVVDKKFASLVPENITPDSMAHINLVSFEPNEVKYHFSSTTNQFAVFSEIYYNKGWSVYINGKKADYLRADYLLRAMPLKAGNYNIDFRFRPLSYFMGNTIALISSIIMILALITFLLFKIKNLKKETK